MSCSEPTDATLQTTMFGQQMYSIHDEHALHLPSREVHVLLQSHRACGSKGFRALTFCFVGVAIAASRKYVPAVRPHCTVALVSCQLQVVGRGTMQLMHRWLPRCERVGLCVR